MVDFLSQVAEQAGACLWIDDTEYASRLLASGAPPWLDVASLIAWRQQAQSLLRPSVTVLDAGALAEAWLAQRPELRNAAFAKSGPARALGAIFADSGLKQHVSDALTGLRRSYPLQPLALAMPSPLRWIAGAIAQMPQADPEPDEDEIEDSAVNLADFLRAFGRDGVDVLALAEDPRAAALAPGLYELYDPVFNVAGHYRWAVGLDLTALAEPAEIEAPVDFVIASESRSDCLGQDVSASVWAGDTAPALNERGFRFLRIPADKNPEEVLTSLATLRSI
jgi:hypothetical protein